MKTTTLLPDIVATKHVGQNQTLVCKKEGKAAFRCVTISTTRFKKLNDDIVATRISKLEKGTGNVESIVTTTVEALKTFIEKTGRKTFDVQSLLVDKDAGITMNVSVLDGSTFIALRPSTGASCFLSKHGTLECTTRTDVVPE